jgi:uncharacterized RDD family membrane protein YckC
MPEQEVPLTTPALPPHPESLSHLPSTATETAPVGSGTIAGPWLRFFARSVDIHIGVFLLSLVVAILLPSLFQANGFFASQLGSTLFGMLLLPFAMAFDAAAYAICGNTLGKWTAGIKVKTIAGDRVSFFAYLKRNFSLYIFGYGAGIPIVCLVTMGSSYSHAEVQEPARWDETAGTRPFVNSVSTPRLVVVGAIWLVFFAGEIAARFL